MTILATIAGVFLLSILAGWLLAKLDPPPRQPPERLVNRLWASKSLWRERK